MPTPWKAGDYLIKVSHEAFRAPELPLWIAERVFRQDFIQPGFACLRLTDSLDSFRLRQLMVSLKESLSRLFQSSFGPALEYYSLGRFDQKKTTRLHLDGGPTCSFLMLGYEPSEVRSRFLIGDFSQCAASLGVTPSQFLENRNPMLTSEGREALKPWTLEIEDWDERQSRIVIINNGSLNPGNPLPGLGVLHGAEVLDVPHPETPRIINSTMFVVASEAVTDARDAIQTFMQTDEISGSIL